MSDELLGPADLKKLTGTADRAKQARRKEAEPARAERVML